MRVYLDARDKYRGRLLYEAIIELLYARHYAGATAFHGVSGFGASTVIQTEHILTFTDNLPIVVECADTDERIQSIMPEIDEMMGGGLITLEKVRVIMYRKDPSDRERSKDAAIDVTGSWQVVERPT